ncbi:MAG: MobF family relaxase [Acidimicrobiales bacterium]
MLRVARLIRSSGAYYMADRASELELGVPGHPGPAGRWWGRGAAGLGLAGPVAPDELAAVLAGRHPSSGRALARRRGEVTGYDLTFAAPKSASVVFGLGDPVTARAVLDGHLGAVEAAMGYVADHALAGRRRAGEARSLEPVEGPVAATFPHGVSRALDPHLHTHVVVANVAHGADSRWTAVDSRGIFAHAVAAGRLYDAHLRRELAARLGATWSLRRSGCYEIDGIDPAAIGALSGRRAEIRGHLADMVTDRREAPWDRRPPSSRARAVAWAVTRQDKAVDLDAPSLRRRWRALAEDVGVDRSVLGLLRRGRFEVAAGDRRGDGPAGGERPPGALDEHRFTATLWRTPHATATRRQAVAAWAGAMPGGSTGDDVERCVDTLREWGPEVGVGEQAHPLAGLVPPGYLVRDLGPRPGAPELLSTWLRASVAVERYRSRWSVDGPAALGIEGSPADLARLPARRLAEHLAVRSALCEARRLMGRDRGRDGGAPEWSLGRG